MTELKDMMARLAEQQRQMISQGVDTQTIAHRPLFALDPEAEVIPS